MSHDLATTIQQIRSLHAAGLLDDEELDQKLDRLRTTFGAAAVESALAALDQPITPQAPINVTGQTGDISIGDVVTGNQQKIEGGQVGAAIAGNVYGPIFISGYRAQDRVTLLREYLTRMVEQCAAMPMQVGVGERDTDDGPKLQLDQVYIQLATTALAARERFVGEALRRFDAVAYLRDHTGPDVLPANSRTILRIKRADDPSDTRPNAGLEADLLLGLGERGGKQGGLLTSFSAEQLTKLARDPEVVALQFTGPQLVTEAIAAQRCLVLMGEPGSGKSTVLRYLAHNLARAGLDATYDPAQSIDGWGDVGRLLPIFVPLLPLARQLAQHPTRHGSERDLWDYIVDRIQPRGTDSGLPTAVYEELTAGNVILMLDGLDEVAGPASRHQVVQAVGDFAEHYPRCRIVVSCRTRAYDLSIHPANQRWQLPGWPTATLGDLTLAQMHDFVGAWYRAVAANDPVIAAQCTERIAKLREALRDRRDLRDLGVRSLLLTIMALIHLRSPTLPEGRASLYRECVEILLARWELRGKAETEYKTLMDYIGLPGVEVKALRPLLAQVALRAHEAQTPQNPGLLSADTLQIMVQHFLRQKGHPDAATGAQRFLEYTDYRAGLLHAANAGNDYQFAHMTFQEYLAGLALVGAEQPVQELLKWRHTDRWRIPIFLGIGHAVSEGLPYLFRELLDHLMTDPATEGGQRDLILAAELGADVRWERLEGPGFVKARRELAQALATVVEGTVLPAADRVRAGELLGDLGDPRPGVCSLPPAMVRFARESLVLGSDGEELDIATEEFFTEYRVRGNPLANDMKPVARELLGGWKDAQPVAISLGVFELARYPVTNAQYAIFMEQGGYEVAQPWWSDAARLWLRRGDQATEGIDPWQRRSYKQQPEFWDDPRFGKTRPNHPVVGISWYEATAFCAWLTRFLADGSSYCLPSEAEWEYAARGLERLIYPWGKEPPNGERANFEGTHNGTSAVGCFLAGTAPEGKGILDLAGNVWEWTCSAFQDYPYDSNDGRENPADPAEKRFTVRGGSWSGAPLYLRAAYRNPTPLDAHNRDLGFRLARRRGRDE